MKILHTADWHIGQFKGPVVDGVNLRSQDTVKCLEYMVDVAIKERPDIVCISGDIFHQEQIGPVRYSDEMIHATNIITSLAHFAGYVIVMRGTPNHDGSGQFRVLKRMLLNVNNVCVVTEPFVIKTKYADIACIPGFDKQEFRAKFPGLSADEENLAWTKYISDMVFALRAECEKTPILMAHYTVPGCNMESGQTSFFTNFEPVIPREALIAARYEAVLLGHSNPTDDRGNAGLHAKANRVIITKIEDYDSNNSAVYVDNGGTKFSTGSTMVGSTEVKTTIVTMPWHTGACDNVLGSCGSPNSNTSGKDPYILFGVEMFLGFYEVISNVILKISNHVMTACICYDCTKLATSVTSDYVECGYSIADTQESWKYISELGYDPENPSVRHGTKVAASSSTGYADGQYTNKLDQTSDGLREWLSGGDLGAWSGAGRWYARLANGLGVGWWSFAARLSASGRCAKAAA